MYKEKTTYDSESGIQLVGMDVTNCCQTRVPNPKNTHHAHCSNVRLVVEKATLPNSTMITWNQKYKQMCLFSNIRS